MYLDPQFFFYFSADRLNNVCTEGLIDFLFVIIYGYLAILEMLNVLDLVKRVVQSH